MLLMTAMDGLILLRLSQQAKEIAKSMPEESENSITFGALCTSLSAAGLWQSVFLLLEDMLTRNINGFQESPGLSLSGEMQVHVNVMFIIISSSYCHVFFPVEKRSAEVQI